jgi:tetratricopeptide (TPR) repeat protein
MKKNCILFIGLCLVSQIVFAKLPLADIYGLRDEKALQTLIAEEQNEPASTEESKRLGIAWHNLAVLEKSGAAEKSFEILSPLHKTLPKDYEVLAYLGSAQTMIARDSWNVMTKISEANRGMALIDQAVNNDKDNYIIRLVRANNSMAVPKFFGRMDKAKEDLEYLVLLFKRETVPTILQSETYYLLGGVLNKQDNKAQAKVYWQQAIQAAPESVWAKKAQGELND